MAKITIELGDDSNRTFMFAPSDNRLLRGYYSRFNTKPLTINQGSAMNQMPDHPGIRIEVDEDAKTCRIYDPLAEDPALMKQISAIHLSEFKHPVVPVDETVKRNCDALTIRTWLWHMQRYIEKKEAKMVAGSAPIPEVTGEVLVDVHNYGPNSVQKRYVVKGVISHEAPEPVTAQGKKQPATAA